MRFVFELNETRKKYLLPKGKILRKHGGFRGPDDSDFVQGIGSVYKMGGENG